MGGSYPGAEEKENCGLRLVIGARVTEMNYGKMIGKGITGKLYNGRGKEWGKYSCIQNRERYSGIQNR